MKLQLTNREKMTSFIVDCKTFEIKDGDIVCHDIDGIDGTTFFYPIETYACELIPSFLSKVKLKWTELTRPCLDDAILEDAVKYLCDILCIIEAIPDDESRVEYLRYIFKHADKWQEDEINELIHIAM